jgi:hypothetical protein
MRPATVLASLPYTIPRTIYNSAQPKDAHATELAPTNNGK